MPSAVNWRTTASHVLARDGPPRIPKTMKPSRQRHTSRVRPMEPPERLPRSPCWNMLTWADMLAAVIASAMETSTCWGVPDASAVNAARATSPATWA